MSNSEMLNIYIGYDHRQPVSFHVLAQSIMARSSMPLSITPIMINQIEGFDRMGLTPFTFSRFLVPYLNDYKGWALFLDIDMLLMDDVSKLFALKDEKYAIMVSKNSKRFEWASAMFFNCAHEANKILTKEYVNDPKTEGLHGISWLDDSLIGCFPQEWNHLVGYDKPRKDASLVHYTQGVPCFKETIDSEWAQEWHDTHRYVNFAHPWLELMGPSVHAAKDKDGNIVPRYKVEPPQ